MGKIKTADPLAGINGKVRRWKDAHIAEVRAKAENETARKAVKDALVGAGVEHANTPSGPVALTHRSGSTSIDWEGLARKHVAAETIAAELPAFTSVGAPSVVLAAPQAWGVEAKSKPAD